MLADSSRRQLLVALDHHSPQNNGAYLPATEVTCDDEDEEDRQTLQLIHSHLPKLDDVGLIEWDRETHGVREGPRFDEIRPLVESLRDYANDRVPAHY